LTSPADRLLQINDHTSKIDHPNVAVAALKGGNRLIDRDAVGRRLEGCREI
jgi:hypothetical protein